MSAIVHDALGAVGIPAMCAEPVTEGGFLDLTPEPYQWTNIGPTGCSFQ